MRGLAWRALDVHRIPVFSSSVVHENELRVVFHAIFVLSQGGVGRDVRQESWNSAAGAGETPARAPRCKREDPEGAEGW